jgi:hypothetical protein
MKIVALAGGTLLSLLVILVVADAARAIEPDVAANTATSSDAAPAAAVTTAVDPALLYARVTLTDGATHEGRVRFGGDQEAFWGNYFNGFKRDNPWARHVPGAQERRPIEIFGFEISAIWESQNTLGRQLMARFGDIARIDALGRDLRVTLKSGTVISLDRFAADDVADGLRLWDATRGVVDFDEWRIRSIEFLPSRGEATAERLHGTVRTAHGAFTGFIQWDQEQCVGTDELLGHTADGELRLRFDAIRSIARRSRDSALATLADGREVVLSDNRNRGGSHRGIYVDDRRYGRVLVSWDAFERIDFSAGGSGPAYADFPAGRPLTGSVTTRDGRRLAGRLVYDLDESETTETLDAPRQGVDYTIPFGMIRTIALAGGDEDGARARVTLQHGEELSLDRTGDLGDGHAGVLVFADGQQRPDYVRWTDVARIDLDRPPAMYPPLNGR